VGNNIEKLPLKKRVISGIGTGLLYASLMAGLDYFTDQPFVKKEGYFRYWHWFVICFINGRFRLFYRPTIFFSKVFI